jgi:hypothetical protein
MEDAGEPLLAVPVRTELKLPVVPLLVVVVLLELVVLPPPQAASAAPTDNASRRPAKLQPNCRRCGAPTNSIDRRITAANEIESAAAQLVVFHGWPKGMSLLAEVVFTVTVTGIPVVADVDEVKVTLLEATPLTLKLHVAAGGKFEQPRVTGPVYPFTG